jgi:hypothetical protein
MLGGELLHEDYRMISGIMRNLVQVREEITLKDAQKSKSEQFL